VFERLRIRAAVALFIVSVFAGCANPPKDPRDPFEQMNRGIYQFNDAVDKSIFQPVAEAYRAMVPTVVRQGVSNFFANLNDVINALNNLLQGKVSAAANDFGRIVINTVAGIGGLRDVATPAGLEKHDEDFGQTLGRWGFDDGPFLMLPLFGPSNYRDALGRLADLYIDPITYVRPKWARNVTWGIKFVQRRSELLDASQILETAALDPYEFIRDAYIQRRRNMVYDGSPPPDSELDLERPKTGTAPVPAAARKVAVAGPALSNSEIDALVQSLPPVMPLRRTARASLAPITDFDTP
jgi:phospholipid-binding lipoprotein MlaA